MRNVYAEFKREIIQEEEPVIVDAEGLLRASDGFREVCYITSFL